LGSAIVFLLVFNLQGGESVAKSKTPAKRARRAEANRLRNKAYKSKLKTAIKNYENAIIAEDLDTASNKLLQVTSLLDRSITKGILHKNNVARKKSALSKKLNSISQ